MDNNLASEPNERRHLRAIVEKGVRYACQRFPESQEVCRLLANAAILESNEINTVLEVVPPRQRGGTATIRYSPHRLADLRRDHRYPEWVLCATIERIVLGSAAQWPLDAQEASLLAAHRERRRRTPSSGTGPLGGE